MLNLVLITYILYANDLILVSDSVVGLQKLLNGLFSFCKKWHTIVNLTKTKIVIFNKRKLKDIKFVYNGNEVEIVYKYVGTTFSSNTQNIFKKNKAYLALKAQHALFALNNHISNCVGYLLPVTAMKMFEVQIRPILEYAHEILYNGKTTNKHEKTHLSYMNEKLSVKRSSCTNAIYAEFGRFPLIIKQKVEVLKYWQRLLSLPYKHALKQSYNCLKKLHESG